VTANNEICKICVIATQQLADLSIVEYTAILVIF